MRQANPGEYSYRAFLNGKLDLSQAEGIQNLVKAETEQEWHAARHLANGSVQKKINNLRQTLLTSLTHLEASIDFPEEEEITALQKSRHSKNIEEVSQQVKALINSYNSGKVSKDGLSVTLVGHPMLENLHS